MRLHELIPLLDEEELRDLAARCIPGASSDSLGLLRTELEAKLRQSDYVEGAVFARRPPAFAVVTELLSADGLRVSTEALAAAVGERTRRWREGVTTGELLAKDDKRALYRKLLRAAWVGDLKIDASEASLLGLLRHELGLSRGEHFLLAFHDSIAHLWDGTHDSRDLLRVLRHHGLVWQVGDDVVLAEEMEAPIRRATGMELNEQSYLRMLERLGGAVLKEVLGSNGLAKSGSKRELSERLVANLIPPSTVLDSSELARTDLASVARSLGLPTGNVRKDELAQNIIRCFRTGADLTAGTSEPEPPAPVEAKELDEPAFFTLFRPLRGDELRGLLERLDLPLSGAKDVRIGQLWNSRFCEATLLNALKGEAIGRICEENGVSRAGKKADQIERVVKHLRTPTVEEGPVE